MAPKENNIGSLKTTPRCSTIRSVPHQRQSHHIPPSIDHMRREISAANKRKKQPYIKFPHINNNGANPPHNRQRNTVTTLKSSPRVTRVACGSCGRRTAEVSNITEMTYRVRTQREAIQRRQLDKLALRTNELRTASKRQSGSGSTSVNNNLGNDNSSNRTPSIHRKQSGVPHTRSSLPPIIRGKGSITNTQTTILSSSRQTDKPTTSTQLSFDTKDTGGEKDDTEEDKEEENKEEDNAYFRPSEETRNLGYLLPQCLNDMIEVEPADPVDYMSRWLRDATDKQRERRIIKEEMSAVQEVKRMDEERKKELQFMRENTNKLKRVMTGDKRNEEEVQDEKRWKLAMQDFKLRRHKQQEAVVHEMLEAGLIKVPGMKIVPNPYRKLLSTDIATETSTETTPFSSSEVEEENTESTPDIAITSPKTSPKKDTEPSTETSTETTPFSSSEDPTFDSDDNSDEGEDLCQEDKETFVNVKGRKVDELGRYLDKKCRMTDRDGRLLNDAGSLVDAQGCLVDVDGRRINADGTRIDNVERLIDTRGRLINSSGYLIDTFGNIKVMGVDVEADHYEKKYSIMSSGSFMSNDYNFDSPQPENVVQFVHELKRLDSLVSGQAALIDGEANLLELHQLLVDEVRNVAGETTIYFDDQGRKVDAKGRLIDERGHLVNRSGRCIDFQGRLVDDMSYGLIDHQGRAIHANGRLIDERGRFVNDQGQRVDAHGRRHDKSGRLLNERGRLTDVYGRYIDEDNELVSKEGRIVDVIGNVIGGVGRFINSAGQRVNLQGRLVDNEGRLVDIRGRLVDTRGRLVDYLDRIMDEHTRSSVEDFDRSSIVNKNEHTAVFEDRKDSSVMSIFSLDGHRELPLSMRGKRLVKAIEEQRNIVDERTLLIQQQMKRTERASMCFRASRVQIEEDEVEEEEEEEEEDESTYETRKGLASQKKKWIQPTKMHIMTLFKLKTMFKDQIDKVKESREKEIAPMFRRHKSMDDLEIIEENDNFLKNLEKIVVPAARPAVVTSHSGPDAQHTSTPPDLGPTAHALHALAVKRKIRDMGRSMMEKNNNRDDSSSSSDSDLFDGPAVEDNFRLAYYHPILGKLGGSDPHRQQRDYSGLPSYMCEDEENCVQYNYDEGFYNDSDPSEHTIDYNYRGIGRLDIHDYTNG